ncbi:MAG TPA: 2OG-Fe dioxygenase family protein, partial [Flavobacterium sp.]|nr:2OG-Fe dioxygenase family protein [Flavobacterium sp.]
NYTLSVDGIDEYLKEGIRHFWPEIVVTVVLYYLLENGFRRYYEIPKIKVNPEVFEILDIFKKSPRGGHVWILDTSIYHLLPDIGNDADMSKTDEESYEAFKLALAIAISNESHIRILLLHPDTYAASQRNNDLIKEGSDFSREIRRSLRRIHSAVCEISKDSQKGIQVNRYLKIKLYRATPVMKLIKWKDYTSFTLLPPTGKASLANRVQMTDDSDLGAYLAAYFNDIWISSEKINAPSNELTVDFFEDFLMVKIACSEWPSASGENRYVCWGGDEFNLFRPKYLLIYDDDGLFTSLDGKLEAIKNGTRQEKIYLSLTHNNKEHHVYVHATIKKEPGDEEDPVYDNAFYKISRNYNWDKLHKKNPVFRNGNVVNVKHGISIIEIKYESEDFQVTTDRYEISGLLERDKVGYKFLSNKQLNINLTKGFLSTMHSMDLLFSELPDDDKDLILCKNLNGRIGKGKKYVGRKRILMAYRAVVDGQKISITKATHGDGRFYDKEQAGKITYPVVSDYGYQTDKTRKHPYPAVDKEYWTKIKSQMEYTNKYFHDFEHMQSLTHKSGEPILNIDEQKYILKFLESIVKFDLNNIISSKSNETTHWEVYMHLIMNQVSENEIGLVTPELQNKDFHYQTIHLMKRDRIKGGITQILDKATIKDSASLDISFDSLYINCTTKQIRVSQIEYAETPKIENRHEENKIGRRDVIVLEFKRVTVPRYDNDRGDEANSSG